MQIVILKEVVFTIAGEKAKGIIDLLVDKKNVNEFLIAKKLKLTINQTRNILYKLADEGLVSFVRKKDSKKGGWYTYFWTLNPDKGLVRFKNDLVERINLQKKEMASKKNDRFYFCPNCNIDYSEETALAHDYTCPECGQILQLKDNSKEASTLEKEIVKNEELLAKVNVEISIVNEKEEKGKQKRLKIEEKKRKEELEAKRKKRQREAKKLAKSAKKPKKPSKKTKK